MNFNAIFGTPPAYTQALMDEEARAAMQARAGNTGLAALGLSLLANSSGSATPVPLGGLLARGFGAGMTAAQGVYGDALTDWKVAQAMKVAQREEAEAARKDEQRRKLDNLIASGFTQKIPAQYREATIPGMYRSQAPEANAVAPNYNLVQDPSSVVREKVAEGYELPDMDKIAQLIAMDPEIGKAQMELLKLRFGLGKEPKSPFAPPDVKDFTQESVAAAMGEDGTFDVTKLVPRAPSPDKPQYTTVNGVPYLVTPSGLQAVIDPATGKPFLPKPDEDKKPASEANLRKEYIDGTKDYREVKASYARLIASQETAAGDLALIFNYMRMLDPGTGVKEGEFANAQNSAGVPDMIRNLYNRTRTGERLNSGQRAMFMSQAEALYGQARKQEGIVRAGIDRIARTYGLSTDNIFYEPTDTPPTAPQSPVKPNPAAAPGAKPGIDDLVKKYSGGKK